MKRSLFVVVIAAFSIGAAAGQAPDKKAKGFLSVLKEGQVVSLRESAGRYEIYILDGGPQLVGHKITEIGSDYLVVEDSDGLTETRIPVFSIRAIITLRGPK